MIVRDTFQTTMAKVTLVKIKFLCNDIKENKKLYHILLIQLYRGQLFG